MERWLGKEVNARIEARMNDVRERLEARGIQPTLSTLRVGEKPEDLSYARSIDRVMGRLGIAVVHHTLDAPATTDDVVVAMSALSRDDGVHGILLMQPLPEGVDANRVKDAMAPEKDVDGATLDQLGRTLAGRADGVTYAAPAAVMEMLDSHGVALQGKTVVLVGSGLVVGRPLAMLLADRLATVVMTNVFTEDLSAFTRKADIVVSAAGVPGLIHGDMVRPGQILIDVGVSFVDGTMRGDVDLESVADIVAAATPTPGGIGSITTTLIAERTVRAAERAANQSK